MQRATKGSTSFALTALSLFCLGLVALAQDLPMKVKGGHVLDETADQFFSKGHEKETLATCAAGDFKGLKKDAKRLAKAHCAELSNIRSQATSGKRIGYESSGDNDELRAERYTFDGGHLVKVEVVYLAPTAESNYHGKSFDDIFAGAKEAYGPPTSQSSETIQNAYSLHYVLHRALWVAPRAAVLLTEQPSPEASVTLSAFTRAEYDRTAADNKPKPSNPME